MQPRQHVIFRATVREYIRRGVPVGSETLAARFRLPLSAATIRAEFASLERDGYLFHPHTSAGRVPTVSGYRYYVDHCIPKGSDEAATLALRSLTHNVPPKALAEITHALARTLAHLTGTLAIVALEERSVHEAGVGHALQRPEFADRAAATELARVLAALEDEPETVSASIDDGVRVFINGEIPFARARRVSVVAASHPLPDGRYFLSALVGPLRMPYDRTVHVLESLDSVFSRPA